MKKRNTANDSYELLEELLLKKLSNLDKCSVRGEYKVAIYSRYVMPALRFHLSVHTVHQTHLDKLDHLKQRNTLNHGLSFQPGGSLT